MKAQELRPCDKCLGPVSGNTKTGKELTFRVVRTTRYALDVRAIQSHLGMTFLTGSEELARVFGSKPELAHALSTHETFLCEACFNKLELYELPGRESEK